MRDFLNSVLAFINATSLTDGEFDTVEATVAIYSQETYDDLARILETRESVSTMQERLIAVYAAKGVDVSEAETGKTNIYLGDVLE